MYKVPNEIADLAGLLIVNGTILKDKSKGLGERGLPDVISMTKGLCDVVIVDNGILHIYCRVEKVMRFFKCIKTSVKWCGYIEAIIHTRVDGHDIDMVLR